MFTRQGEHTTVALLLGRMPVGMIAPVFKFGHVHLLRLGLSLLDADHVEVMLVDPVNEPLVQGSPDAVQIVGEDGFCHRRKDREFLGRRVGGLNQGKEKIPKDKFQITNKFQTPNTNDPNKGGNRMCEIKRECMI